MAQPVTIAAHSSSLLGVQVLRSDLSSKAGGAIVTGFLVAFKGTLGAPPGPAPVSSKAAATAVPIIARTLVAAPAAAAKPAAASVPTIDAVLLNKLRPINIILPATAAGTVRITRQVRLRLQDQQLPAPLRMILHPGPVLLDTLTKAGTVSSSVASPARMAVDSATNVVSVPLATATPAPAQMAQLRHSVLAAMNTANTGGAK
jgi:hypothetical protein